MEPKPQAPAITWLQTLLVGAGLAAIYLANGREIGSYDTEPTNLVALTIIRGEGPFLDRFRTVLHEPDGRVSDFATRRRGLLLSRYPLGPALVAVPVAWLQVRFWDLSRPGWDAHPYSAWPHAKLMGKRAAAILAALLGMALHRLLLTMGLRRAAWPSVVAATLGSDLWAVGSQALWQHGPAALGLVLAMLALLPPELTRRRAFGAGAATALMVSCRAMDLVFAVVILTWMARCHPRRLGWFLPVPVLAACALLTYNVAFFDGVSGGQAGLESVHPHVHGVAGPWSGNPFKGLAGTLMSPSRGLFVYCPWVALALLVSPFGWSRLRPRSLSRWLAWALVPYLLILSKYAVWWAGHTFGPRYWVDATPVFAVLLAVGLEWSFERCWPVVWSFGLTITWSVVIQAIGAFCYPSSWNLSPTNVDRHHERLWDWKDTEVRRCLIEGRK
jgi:hypothetical protein